MSTFLSEFVDGGPRCMRDDCMITHNGPHQPTTEPDIIIQPMRCLSCGKSWVERWQNGIRISAE